MTRPTSKNIHRIKKIPHEPKNTKVTVVLLASVPGYRIKSYGIQSLIKLTEKIRLIDYQLDVINNVFPNSEIIVVTGFESDKIQRYANKRYRIVENVNYEHSGDYEDVRLALNNRLNETCLIIYGDTIFTETNITNIDGSCVIVKEEKDTSLEIGVTQDDHLKNMSFGLPNNNKWCGIVYLERRELNILQSVCSNRDMQHLMLFEGINESIDKNARFNIVNCEDNRITKIDSSDKILGLTDESFNFS